MSYKYCPVCMGEYEPGVKKCKECNMDLVKKEELLVEKEIVEELLCVYRAQSEVQALAIVSLLDEAGIFAKASSKQVPMYDDVFKASLGYWGEILVKKSDLKEGEKLIEEYLKAL